MVIFCGGAAAAHRTRPFQPGRTVEASGERKAGSSPGGWLVPGSHNAALRTEGLKTESPTPVPAGSPAAWPAANTFVVREQPVVGEPVPAPLEHLRAAPSQAKSERMKFHSLQLVARYHFQARRRCSRRMASQALAP